MVKAMQLAPLGAAPTAQKSQAGAVLAWSACLLACSSFAAATGPDFEGASRRGVDGA